MNTDTTLRLLMGIMIIFPTDADGLAFEAKTTPEEAEGFLKEWATKGALRLAEDGQFHLQNMAPLDAEYKRLAPPEPTTKESREIFEIVIRSIASRIGYLQQLYLGKTVNLGDTLHPDAELTPENKSELLQRVQMDLSSLKQTTLASHLLLERLHILLKLATQEACTQEEIYQLVFAASKKAED